MQCTEELCYGVAGVEERKTFFMAFFIRESTCPKDISPFLLKGAALYVIRSKSLSLLKEYSIKIHYETDHASQFTGLQGLLMVTENSTVKQSCLLSQHKECTGMPNVSDPVILLTE